MKCVVIIHGTIALDAPEDEQDSLNQIKAVSDALNNLGYDTIAVPITLDLKKCLETIVALQPNIVFNLVESLEGKGRYLPYIATVLQENNIPFTGAKADTLLYSTNKLIAKSMMFHSGIPTAPWVTFNECFSKPLFNPPYIMKSVWEHASIGLSSNSILLSDEKLVETLVSNHFFIEQYIEGREFNISVIETLTYPKTPIVLPIAEILFDGYDNRPHIVDYKAKWQTDSFEYNHTPRTFDFKPEDALLLKKLKAITLEVWNIFGMTGYGRVDFRVDSNNNPYVLELNTNPCISPDSGFVAAAEKYGLTYDQMIKMIVEK